MEFQANGGINRILVQTGDYRMMSEGDLRWGGSARGNKVLFVMVGLPARGKSYIAKKLVSYFSWLGIKTKLFNVGNFRRETVKGDQTSDFFDATNVSAKETRERLAFAVLEEALQWLNTQGSVAVFDATNTTAERRTRVSEFCKEHFSKLSQTQLNLVFIESICNDKQILEDNFNQKIKNSPDYKLMPYEEAAKDLAKRILNYEKVYEPIEDDATSYIKLINLRSKVISNRIYGTEVHMAVAFLMSIHIGNRTIWLTRTGHTTDDRPDLDAVIPTEKDKNNPMLEMMKIRVGLPSSKNKSSHLNARGLKYAQKLTKFLETKMESWPNKMKDLKVFTSTLPRSVETVQYLETKSFQLSTLNMLDTGDCSGLSIEEFKQRMPEGWEAWQKDPFHYRLPGGESYRDVVRRLEPFIIDLERETKPVLVVSHLSTLQVLYGYFVDCPVEKSPQLSLPMHTVIQLTPHQYGWKEERFQLPV